MDAGFTLATMAGDPITDTTAAPAGKVVAATRQGACGSLNLRFRLAHRGCDSQTVVETVEQQPPLRLIRAFSQADGAALVHLHNISGGVLGGDQLSLSAHIESGARAQITTTGATRVYRHRADRVDAQQVTRFTIGPGGFLEYLPDPLIPYAGSRYRQATEFFLEEDAGLIAWDVITPGRAASGECFQYEHLAIENLVTVNNQPILLEHQILDPVGRGITTPAGMGCYRTQASLLICRAGWHPTQWSGIEERLRDLSTEISRGQETIWGSSTLVADGLLMRGLAMEARHLIEALPKFWRLAKHEIFGMDAILPRKIY